MDFLPLKVRNTLANLFQPDPVQLNPNDLAQQDLTGMTSPEQSSNNLSSMIQSLLQPQNTAGPELQNLLANQPQRQDFKPSPMANVMSRLSGLSSSGPAGQANGQMIGYKGMGIEGQKIVDSNLNRGYNQAMDSWEAKLKPLNELADTERADNTNRRMIAGQMQRDENTDLERERRTTADENKSSLEKGKLAEKYAYLAVVAEKNKNAHVKLMSDSQGYIFSADPISGSSKYVLDADGNKVKGDKLPEMEKLEIQQNNEMSRIAARGNQARQTVAAQGNKEVDVSNKTLGNKKELKAATPGKNTAAVEGSGSPKAKTPKVGDEKVFPNGKVGKWDGNGWANTGKVAK